MSSKMIELPPRSLLLVVSAPSGAGKTTLCERLLGEFHSTMIYSISCTTRAPREGEVDGREYFFLTEEQFKRKLDAGEFLEVQSTTLEALEAQARDGIVTDAKTMIGMLWLRQSRAGHWPLSWQPVKQAAAAP